MFFIKKDKNIHKNLIPIAKHPDFTIYNRSNYGRFFGWWLCINKERVADINYLGIDMELQFWCVYKVFPFDPRFNSIEYNPDLWCSDSISLESRYIEGYYIYDFVMSHIKENLIRIRGKDFIPEDMF